MKRFSFAGQNVSGQPMFAFLDRMKEAERAGRKIIHFEIGDLNMQIPQEAASALKNSIDKGEHRYTESKGLWDFRKKIAEHFSENYGFEASIDQILVAPANSMIDFMIRSVADHGDEVICPDPGFPTYYSVMKYSGVVPVPYPLLEENGFQINPKDIEKRITEKTRLIILNSPSNPTGAIMDENVVRKVAEIARENDIYVFSDEVYGPLAYTKKHFSPSFLDQCREQTVILGSLSKVYGMSGWRLGYAIGPTEVIKKMGLMMETIFSCLPIFTQRGGIAAINVSERIISERKKELQERMKILIGGLNSFPGVKCRYPEGAFYAFPNIEGTGMSGTEFRDSLFDKADIGVLEGEAFGVRGKGHARMAFGASTQEQIMEAIDRMKKIL